MIHPKYMSINNSKEMIANRMPENFNELPFMTTSDKEKLAT